MFGCVSQPDGPGAPLNPSQDGFLGQAIPQGDLWGQSSTVEEAPLALAGAAVCWASHQADCVAWRVSNRRPDLLGKRTGLGVHLARKRKKKTQMFISRRERNCNHGAGPCP